MASKILSFLCHVPGLTPGAFPSVPAPKSAAEHPSRRSGTQLPAAGPVHRSSTAGGHFAAIYENERFVRFKYMQELGGETPLPG
ncbi:hypothetical protein HER32_16615 [Hymenobacter sp. BT18]|uniref:hypothetical protein n=1 Tax=Hymenobacter sp. BT18 TaxID=2835648 RepID=UPI00143E4A83|nr:hypothetical protein [Hymenobacter sp. BT18]QIX62705.1 hypothetical protein HER32_16615 [Hymenobacter sp. BT18]